MCNKSLQTKEEVKINFKKHQIQAINVDNECFYSDHIIVRKPTLLKPFEFKRTIMCAMPHEPNHMWIIPGAKKKKTPADDSEDLSD